MKKGFVLLTTLLLITALGFLALTQLTLSTVSAKILDNYYLEFQDIYAQESQTAYTDWLAAQHP